MDKVYTKYTADHLLNVDFFLLSVWLRLIENQFFTGEVIDVDAETGGYNLQIAFSTGYLAGISV